MSVSSSRLPRSLATPAQLAAALLVGVCGLTLAGDGGPFLDREVVNGASPLLKRGELILVQSKPDGSPKEATAMAAIDAPADVVWKTITDYAKYPSFVPRVVSAEVVRREPGVLEVSQEVEVPGRNPKTTIRYIVDETKRTLDGRWLSGDLRGGRWSWALYAGENGGTIATYTTHAAAGSGATQRLVESLDDEWHTLAFALDASSALLMMRAVKKEAERRAKVQSRRRF